ncbi:hypothetical protein ACS0TY_029064 [Phlomoides rotata]
MPEATISDVDFKGFGLEGITLLAKVSVSNPYSVPISIGEIAYKVKSVERQIVSGSIPDPESLKSNDTTLLEVTVKVSHSAVVSLVHDIGGDWDIDYLLELRLIIDLLVIENITIPMSYKGEMKLPAFSGFFFGKSVEGIPNPDGKFAPKTPICHQFCHHLQPLNSNSNSK